MKRKVLLLAIFLGAAILIALAAQYSTEAQQRDRAAGGRGADRSQRQNVGQFVTRALPLEASWAFISFQLDTSDDSLIKIRAIYQKAWTGRAKLVKKAGDSQGDREAMQEIRSAVEKLGAEVTSKLGDVLTPEQVTKMDRWRRAYRNRTQRQRRAPGGDRPPRGGRPE